MQNPANTGVVWNLVTNSPYLLVPNPFYNNGSGYNLPDQAPPPSNQAPPPSNLNADEVDNIFNTIWETLGSPPTVAENVENPEVVGNVGVVEVESVGDNLGSLLLENPPPMVEAENVGNPPMVRNALREFDPQDLQLVTFLTRRLRNEPLEVNTIHEINFYAYPPQYLADNYAHGVPGMLFFFTPVRRLYGQKAVRKVNGEGGGSWSRVSGNVKWIKGDGNRVVGGVKSFKFAPKNPNPNDITWLMKEYNLPNEEPQHESENVHECVLVKLHSSHPN